MDNGHESRTDEWLIERIQTKEKTRMNQLRRIQEILKMFGLTEMGLPNGLQLSPLTVSIEYTDVQIAEFAYFIKNSLQNMQNHESDWNEVDEYDEALKDLDKWVDMQENGKQKIDTTPQPTNYSQRYALASDLIAAHEGRKLELLEIQALDKKLGNREQKHDLETERENNGNGRDTER